MKGRSPSNRPDVRKTEIYGLLTQLGGRARWRDLKALARRHQIGPTTLKRTLDKMEEEDTTYVEVKRGPGGPETWYCLQLTPEEVWAKLERYPVGKRAKDLAGRLGALKADPNQQDELLTRELPDLFADYMLEHLAILVKVAEEEDPEKGRRLWMYLYDTVLLEEGAAILGLILGSPQPTKQAANCIRVTLDDMHQPGELTAKKDRAGGPDPQAGISSLSNEGEVRNFG